MLYNNKYKDDSIRLKNYDYTQGGSYFITICTNNKEYLFGHISDGKMILNDAGIMLEKWYFEMENKYPNIRCCEYTVMPNHFHCIITIIGKQNIPNDIMDAHERNWDNSDDIVDAHVGAPYVGVQPPTNIWYRDHVGVPPLKNVYVRRNCMVQTIKNTIQPFLKWSEDNFKG